MEHLPAVVITVPTSNNPNLNAQGGLFTLVRFRPGKPPRLDEDIPGLDALIGDPPLVGKPPRLQLDAVALPVLYKFTLPHEQASRLLHFLHLCDVDASTIYPGHKSVSDCMCESRYRRVTRPGGE